MKKIALIVSLALFVSVSFSCVSVNDMVRQHFRSLRSNDEITVVIFGDSTSGSGGIQEFGESYSSFIKLKISDLFECTVSLLNASRPGAAYQIAHRRIQEDILSFRPDITFVMLGVNDAFQPGYLMSEHIKNVDKFYSIIDNSNLRIASVISKQSINHIFFARVNDFVMRTYTVLTNHFFKCPNIIPRITPKATPLPTPVKIF